MGKNETGGNAGQDGAASSFIWTLGSLAAACVLVAILGFAIHAFVGGRSAAPAPRSADALVEEAAPEQTVASERSFSPEAVARGQAIYAQACVACHGQDLRGGVGFNLVDGEWVHGSSREEILANIKSGFPAAGMVGFETMYSDEQLSDVIDYIFSQREGWESVSYAIWPLETVAEEGDWRARQAFDFAAATAGTPAKSGRFTPAQADFGVPERENYVMAVNGTVHIPPGFPAAVWISGGGNARIDVTVDGEMVTPIYDMAGTTYPIAQGLHDLEILFTTTGKPEWFPGDLVVLVANPDTGARHFPLSEAGRRFLNATSFPVMAQGEPRAIRKRVKNMPSSTISVGLPAGMNYGFNTRTCSIVGLWDGDFLDIGPNIDGRGQAAAFPLGDWIFHDESGIALNTEGSLCQYQRMSREPGSGPVFHFAIGDVSYAMTAEATGDSIEFIFSSEDGMPVPDLTLPEMDRFAAHAGQDGGGGSVSVVLDRSAAQ